MITKTININSIKPYWRNPKKNESVIAEIVVSIKKFGYQSPIIVDDKNVIIVGHARHKALIILEGKLNDHIKKLKKEIEKEEESKKKTQIKNLINNLEKVNSGNVDIIVAKDLSENQAKEYRITDNKLHEKSSWDFEKLKLEIQELENVIGFSDEEIERLLKPPKEKEEEKRDVSFIAGNSKNKITLMCPHCYKKFELLKKELQKKFSEK